METNDHWLRVTGKVNLPVGLEIDTEYQLVGEITTYGTESGSKQDGSYSITSKAQFSGEVQLIKGEQVIRGQKKSSNSAKWRRLIEGNGINYDSWMQWQFSKFDEMREEYEARST